MSSRTQVPMGKLGDPMLRLTARKQRVNKVATDSPGDLRGEVTPTTLGKEWKTGMFYEVRVEHVRDGSGSQSTKGFLGSKEGDLVP